MKIYKIIDESNRPGIPIAFLYYYEKSRAFTIEISGEFPGSRLPVFFYCFAKKGIYSIDNEWSERWVRERVVPQDRQNLGAILRDNKIREYDIHRLLIRSHGRCAQDDCAVFEARQSDLPLWIAERQSEKLSAVFALSGCSVLLCYNNEKVQVADLTEAIEADRSLLLLRSDRTLFESVRLEPGGGGICWNEWMHISLNDLKVIAKDLPLTAEDIRSITERDIVDTKSVCEMLGCSRQYVDRLVREGTLTVAAGSERTRMFHRSDVQKLLW